MSSAPRAVALALLFVGTRLAAAQGITSGGAPAQLDVRPAGGASIRVTLRPLGTPDSLLSSPAVADRHYAPPAISIRTLGTRLRQRVGRFGVEVRPNPLTVVVTNDRGARVQTLVFENDGTVTFALDDQPVLGMGEGGPRPERGAPWREQAVQFDRRGSFDGMEPRWQSDAYGSRNPVAMLVGTAGWGLFVPTPWMQVDLRAPDHGVFIPWTPADSERAPQTARNQGRNLNKGRPAVDRIVPGLYDIFVFDAHDPSALMRDYAAITGPAVLPPKWALGYMQSHRTIEDETQLLRIIDTFREKRIPVDAVIYLGTGFAPRGWNATQPSFAFNPDVFKRDPKAVIADMHARNVKVVVHIVPFDRDKLPSLHGAIPPGAGDVLDAAHIANYWKQHESLIDAGIDAFWPDEGDWFNLDERLARHRMYYEGPLSSRPNVRPWSLHRN
ncbi:MAG: TIM-barrel domain-containing protein, partial [Gemmatimonas sp.]